MFHSQKEKEEKEKHLWKTVVFRQLVFQLENNENERDQAIIIHKISVTNSSFHAK